MKCAQLIVIVALFPIWTIEASTNLLPGITYYPTLHEFAGELIFMLDRDRRNETNSETAASIYEFDLSTGKLRNLSHSPKGSFSVSEDGTVVCVTYCAGKYLPDNDRNAFVYAESSATSRRIVLDSPPKRVAIANEHVFFELEKGNYTRVVDYNFTRDSKRLIELPGASRWQNEDYNRIHVPRNEINALHFYYNGFGDRLEAARDYADGFYRLDIRAGDVRWVGELTDDDDDTSVTDKALDGRYLFFEGRGAPRQGFRLVSSPWKHGRNDEGAGKREKVKLLHEFSKFSGGVYLLDQMSPDGRYALVRQAEVTSSGWVNTYWLVDASAGKTRIFVKDEVVRQTAGLMSRLHWVRASQ